MIAVEVLSFRPDTGPQEFRVMSESATTARTNEPKRVRCDNMTVATREFVQRGYSGARVDDIAAKTHTSKITTYYDFCDKKGLFITIVENIFARIRANERELSLKRQLPAGSLVCLA
jgi:AcrR family transcriptional regulator